MKKDFSNDFAGDGGFEMRLQHFLEEARIEASKVGDAIPRKTGRGSSWAAQGWKHK